MSHDDASAEVVRWYTRARRFPQLIGRTPDGTRIPGGPYTFTQVIGTAIFLILAVKTVDLWGRFDLIGNVVFGAGATVGVVWALGRIPVGARNPLSLFDGCCRAFTAPASGRVAGRQIRIKKPTRVRHTVTVHQQLPNPVPTVVASATAAEPAPPATPEPPAPMPVPATATEPAPRPRPVPPQLTGVQKLLASAPPRSRKAA